MTLRAAVILFVFSVCFSISNSQEQDVLFTVDGDPVYAEDFKQVYQKNLDLVQDDSQKDIDGYLDLYVNYTLKLKEAKALGFDKKPKYLREFNSYRKQLAKNYLTDKNVTEALVKEAYDRISEDVWVSHILIRLPETETDTATVIKQLNSFKERLETEDFETVRQSVHNGKSVIAEDLGYFSGFRTVYPFENAAYKTKIGSVSEPFRTSFGFHILKVNDRRPSKGYATVGHIFLSKETKDSVNMPKDRIQEIYGMIKSGNAFEDMARQFSEEKSTAKNGGKMKRFKSSSLRSKKFENEAFALKIPGDISQPFETEYGWHILKLYQKDPIEPFEDLKASLERRVKGDTRSVVINQSLTNQLKRKYNVNDNVDLSYFVSILDDGYFRRQWGVPANLPQDKYLMSIGDRKLNYFDFASFLEKAQKRIREKQSFEGIVQSQFDAFLENELKRYHEDNLENDNEEFRRIITEYRDGLLLFDLMEDRIWNAVKQDSAGIEAFFNSNRGRYTWPQRVKAIIATASSESDLKKVAEAMSSSDKLEEIQEKVDSELLSEVVFTEGVMQKGDRKLPDAYEFKNGMSGIMMHNNTFHLIKGIEILAPAQKTLDEARGRVISDFQNYKEEQWLKELSEKYEIEINQSVLKKVKKELLN